MAWTTTAVPPSSGMPQCAAVGDRARATTTSRRRRDGARSCSSGSVGTSSPVAALARTSPASRRRRAVEVGAEHGAANSCTKRTCVSRAKSGSPDSAEALLDRVGDPEVEDRVHHPGHAHRGAGAHGDEQRRLGVAEPAAGVALEARDALRTARPHVVVERAVAGVEAAALLDRDDEGRRHRQPERAHRARCSRPCRRRSPCRRTSSPSRTRMRSETWLTSAPRAPARASAAGPRGARTRRCGSCRCARR